MLRTIGVLLAGGAIFLGALGVQAADLKVGFVDAERINRESAPADEASKRLEREFQPRVQDIQRRDQQLKNLQAQFEKDALTLSEGDRRNREQEIARQGVDLQRVQREFQEDLTLRRNQELSGLLERANKIIRQIAEAEKYDLILQEAVYRSPRIDITDRVLKALAGK